MFIVRFISCFVAYSVLFGWKLAYKGLTGQEVVGVFASQLFSIILLTLFQFCIPPAHLNPVGAWLELASGARSFSSAVASTLTSGAAAAAAMQLFLSTVPVSHISSIAAPHSAIRAGDVFLHVLWFEAVLSLCSVLFGSQAIRSLPALKPLPSFVVSNVYLLMQLQTPLMSNLGNVNPASAFASVFLHQQPVVLAAQISGNVLAVALFAYVNHIISNRASQRKQKQD
jgi:hypothetical protein